MKKMSSTTRKILLNFFCFFAGVIVNAQSADLLIIKDSISDRGIKNVNVLLPRQDTILVSDTAGIIDLSEFFDIDTLIIRKFGYEQQVLLGNQRLVSLQKDKSAYSHNLKLLDLKHKDGFSFIKLSINDEIYWFKQKSGPLHLGNGVEIETYQDYADIFQNYKIIKTVHVTTELCLWGIRGENYANWITAIYYDPQIKKKKTKKVPNTVWYSKREMRRDVKQMKLTNGCLE
jgi:hypothetical protein